MHQNSKIPLVKPPDGGWGWMIVLSCFMVTVCTRAISRCISIFFVEFQNHFAQDYAMTAWIHSTVDCTTMLFAPIGSVISNRYSCRVSVILGGLLASAGFILSSFANCLEYLYLSLGVLTGCGYALAYSPSIAIVGEYFHKRKAMAYGIAMSGTGIGTFILAPVVQLLIERYSWRGALLILGGLVLNICVCGALLRPLTRTDNRTRTTVTEKAPEACTYKVQRDNLPLHCSVSHSVLTKIDCSNQQSCCYCPSYQEYTFLLTPDFLVFAVSVLFLSYGCSTPFVYLVPYAINVGVSQQQAAFLMSILGIMDIIGTISFGWITDRRCLKKYRRFCFFLTIGLDGFSSLFIPILKTFPLLVPYALCYGYFDGAYIALLPVVTSDAAGREFLSSALGIIYFIHAIPYLIGPPIAGWLVNTTGTYTAAFFISGLSMMFSSLLVISADWIMSCRNSANVQEVKTDGNIATFHNVANDHI